MDCEQTGNRIHFIDVARGLVIILMVVGHSGAPAVITRAIYGFHMPFFFMLNGLLFNEEKWKKAGVRQFVIAKIKAYIIPYFLLAFVNLILYLPYEIVANIRETELIKSTALHLIHILYSNGEKLAMPNCTPLWFLPCLFVASIYLFLILKINSTSLQTAACVLAIAFYFCMTKTGLNLPQMPWHFETALLAAVFMFIGYRIKKADALEHIPNGAKGILVTISCILIGGYSIFTNPMIDLNHNVTNNLVLLISGAVTITLAILIICKNHLTKSVFVEFLGKNTILIMAFNHAIRLYASIAWYKFPITHNIPYSWWIDTIINLFFGSIIIYIWNKVKKKYPRLNLF